MVAAAKEIRILGRQLVDASMLMFVCGRYEFRKACLLAYGPVAQSLVIAGFEKQMWQEVVDMRMGRMIGGLQALLSSLRVLDLLLFDVVHYGHVRSERSASMPTFAAVVSQRGSGGRQLQHGGCTEYPTLKAFLHRHLLVIDRERLAPCMPPVLGGDVRPYFSRHPVGFEGVWANKCKMFTLLRQIAVVGTCEVRIPHPFSEPFEPIAPASQPSWRQTKFDLRMKTLNTMRTCLERLLSWALVERHQFRARVMYWDSFDASYSRTKSNPAQSSEPACVVHPREDDAHTIGGDFVARGWDDAVDALDLERVDDAS